MERLYVVTHGTAKVNTPDPSLTNEAEIEMAEIRNIIGKEKFDLVVVGVGKRHKQTFEFLFSEGEKPEIEESDLVGVLETISSDKKTMVFPDGKKMPAEEYGKTVYPKKQKELSLLIKKILKRKGENVLIVGGRIVPHTLGEEPTSGALYIFDKKLNLISIHI
jgi:broad specificity phosphatase PhoE